MQQLNGRPGSDIDDWRHNYLSHVIWQSCTSSDTKKPVLVPSSNELGGIVMNHEKRATKTLERKDIRIYFLTCLLTSTCMWYLACDVRTHHASPFNYSLDKCQSTLAVRDEIKYVLIKLRTFITREILVTTVILHKLWFDCLLSTF